MRLLLLPAILLALAASAWAEGKACCEKPVSRTSMLTKGGSASSAAASESEAQTASEECDTAAIPWKPLSISGGALLCLLGAALVVRRKHAA